MYLCHEESARVNHIQEMPETTRKGALQEKKGIINVKHHLFTEQHLVKQTSYKIINIIILSP